MRDSDFSFTLSWQQGMMDLASKQLAQQIKTNELLRALVNDVATRNAFEVALRKSSEGSIKVNLDGSGPW